MSLWSHLQWQWSPFVSPIICLTSQHYLALVLLLSDLMSGMVGHCGQYRCGFIVTQDDTTMGGLGLLPSNEVAQYSHLSHNPYP
jgi:hypothetical protein